MFHLVPLPCPNPLQETSRNQKSPQEPQTLVVYLGVIPVFQAAGSLHYAEFLPPNR